MAASDACIGVLADNSGCTGKTVPPSSSPGKSRRRSEHSNIHATLIYFLGFFAVLMSYTYNAMNDLFGTAGSPAKLKVCTKPPRPWHTLFCMSQSPLVCIAIQSAPRCGRPKTLLDL